MCPSPMIRALRTRPHRVSCVCASAHPRPFSSTAVGLSKTSSSKRFIRRAQTDPYGKNRTSARGEPTYVARSAYKLIQLDQQLGLLPRHPLPTRILDLGAAPGGWTEVVLERLGRLPSGRGQAHCVIACDLLPLASSMASKVPAHVSFHPIEGDFTSATIQAEIRSLLGPTPPAGVATLVLSDMLASLSGVPVRDAQGSFDLCTAVADLAQTYIQPGGPATDGLVLKHLQSDLTEELRDRLRSEWESVRWLKPLASRAESREGYFVARDRKPN